MSLNRSRFDGAVVVVLCLLNVIESFESKLVQIEASDSWRPQLQSEELHV